jgi:hypothetical protein
MKEYIVRIKDSEKDFDEMFVGYIRNCSVEVVRCKDCRWFAGEGMYCTNNILTQFDHFFCYYGERKEDKK